MEQQLLFRIAGELADCAYRALCFASTALDASVADFEMSLTLGDSAYRASACAAAAADASIINNLCHCRFLLHNFPPVSADKNLM